MLNMYKKVYVDVVVLQDKYGKCRPLRIQWEDGTVYSVERLINRCHTCSKAVGGGQVRYTVQINGRETFLYEDNGRWFVEAKC